MEKRPMYESEEDRKNEERIVTTVCHYGYIKQLLTYEKLPISYHVDYALLWGNRVVSWLEVKKRNMSIHDYKTIMLSLLKFKAGIQLTVQTKTTFQFAIEVDEGVYKVDLTDMTPVIKFGGRTTKTRHPDDIEPVIHIPTNMFVKVERDPF